MCVILVGGHADCLCIVPAFNKYTVKTIRFQFFETISVRPGWSGLCLLCAGTMGTRPDYFLPFYAA